MTIMLDVMIDIKKNWVIYDEKYMYFKDQMIIWLTDYKIIHAVRKYI